MVKKYFYLIMIIFLEIIFSSGCGETVQGVSKDAHRIGRGVRTIFVSDE